MKRREEPSTDDVGTSRLPYLDEHTATIEAGVDDVWQVLADALDRTLSGIPAIGYARLVRCADATAAGPRPLAEGATLAGFRVTTAVPGAELVLSGRHYFSTYALAFHLEKAGAARSVLRAESRATFPGVAGGAYRLLVLGTGAHVLGVRRLLATVATRAESRARSGRR